MTWPSTWLGWGCREGTGFCMELRTGVQPNPQTHQFPSAATSSTAMLPCTTSVVVFNVVDFQNSEAAKAAHFACRCSALAASKPL